MKAGTMDRMANFTDADWSRLGDFVRRRRTALGMTQDELADKAEVSINTVGNVESGRRSRELNLSKIVRALGWMPDSFWLILEGGQPMIEDTPSEPEDDDTLKIKRPPGVSDNEWAAIGAKLVSDLEFYLRRQR